MVERYEEQVYAGVLGKVIGVYMGRPFEGWPKERIQERWGSIRGYVHEDRGVPLVVADDDLSGTFTFVRVLEDSGTYAATPLELYGENWLNYVVPGRTIFWWGGMGVSSEHTAFTRLMQGYRPPESGSMALNGTTVAQQIGGQIFIDAFGLVAPGDPAMAAQLARNAASVGHDGAGIDGAVVVAAAVSAAFVEKDINRVMDIAVEQIDADSIIARVQRDVRQWREQDADWERTFERIKKHYGYDSYSGNCHMVPNHAVVVLAWSYSDGNFHRAQEIVNTAGWDTDCNAANVGTVMGLVAGLSAINQDYEFQAPFADRMYLPTAEGSYHVTDCLLEADRIARIGRHVMGWNPLPAPKDGAWHHFSMPGSLHGYLPEEGDFRSRDTCTVRNVSTENGERCLEIRVSGLTVEKVARVSTPIMAGTTGTGYTIMGTPRLYPGMTVTMYGDCTAAEMPPLSARLFVRYATGADSTRLVYSTEVSLSAGERFALDVPVPQTHGWPVRDLGVEILGTGRSSGTMRVHRVVLGGTPSYQLDQALPRSEDGAVVGWINDVDNFTNVMASAGIHMQFYGRNTGAGHLVTGSLDWADYELECDFLVHSGDTSGIIIRYQGRRRFLALLFRQGEVVFVRRLYSELSVLGRSDFPWRHDTVYHVQLGVSGERVVAAIDDNRIIDARDGRLSAGGFGFFVETGLAAFSMLRATGLSTL